MRLIDADLLLGEMQGVFQSWKKESAEQWAGNIN